MAGKTPPIGAAGHVEEQWPLSALDDFPIHQTAEPIRVVSTSDVRFYDRHLLVGYTPGRDLLFAIGGSQYPNLDMAEGFAFVNHAGRHVSLRASRTLGHDRTDLKVGPIQPSIIEGLRAWRFVVEANGFGLSLHLDYRDTIRQVARDPHPHGGVGGGAPAGRHRDATGGFEGFGEISGWLEVEGTRFELGQGDAQATRDRHWGVRNGIGGPDQLFGARPPRGGNGHQFINFGDWAVWADRIFYPFGHPELFRQIVRIERRLRFDEETLFPVEAVIDNTLADGRTKQIHYHFRPHMTGFLRCGFYGGPNGGAPVSDRWHGQLPADQPLEGESVDATTSKGKATLAGLNEHLCDAVCDGKPASGIVQTYDPNAYWRCRNEVPGWSLL